MKPKYLGLAVGALIVAGVTAIYFTPVHKAPVPVTQPTAGTVKVVTSTPLPVTPQVIPGSVEDSAATQKSNIKAKLLAVAEAMNAAQVVGFSTNFNIGYNSDTKKYELTQLVLSARF